MQTLVQIQCYSFQSEYSLDLVSYSLDQSRVQREGLDLEQTRYRSRTRSLYILFIVVCCHYYHAIILYPIFFHYLKQQKKQIYVEQKHKQIFQTKTESATTISICYYRLFLDFAYTTLFVPSDFVTIDMPRTTLINDINGTKI